MKRSECNARQKKAWDNIAHAANWLIGGLENTMFDNSESSEDYKSAKSQLSDHEFLVNELYNMATSEVYGDGFCSFNDNAKSFIKDIRFCGKEWLMERCDKRIKKMGY